MRQVFVLKSLYTKASSTCAKTTSVTLNKYPDQTLDFYFVFYRIAVTYL